MANPYHDAEGKFCSKGEMKSAYEQLAEQGDHEGYFKLRTEYEATSKANAPFEKTIQVTSPVKTETKQALEPINVEHFALSEPTYPDVRSVIDYDYDDYGPPEGYDDDGYGRNNVYTNLRLTSTPPDVKKVLAHIFHVDEDKVPADLIEYATETLNMDKSDSYEISATSGYYGEEVHVRTSQLPALRKWYWNRNNAWDASGVLDYVRGKGLDTTGKTPIEAIKAQLAAENNGKMVAALNESHSVFVRRLSPSEVTLLDAERLQKTEPAPIQSPISKHEDPTTHEELLVGKNIAGVVVHKDNKYFLIDGYARHKGLGRNPNKQQEYIVLSPVKFGYW